MYSYSGVMQYCGAQSNFTLNLLTAASSGLNISIK